MHTNRINGRDFELEVKIKGSKMIQIKITQMIDSIKSGGKARGETKYENT
jgi:hypothetical protein